METLFECKYTVEPSDLSYAEEAFRACIFNRFVKAAIALLAVFACVYAAVLKNFNGFGVLVIFVGILLAVYFNLVSALKRVTSVTPKSAAEVTATVTNSCISLTRTDGKADEAKINEIKYFCRSKRLIVFVTNQRRILSLRKDSFTLGTADDFVGFLKSSGIKER